MLHMGAVFSVADVQARLAALEDPRVRVVNERHGDDHGVNLTKLRALAKEIGSQPDLAMQLWETNDTAAKLVALLVFRPKDLSAQDLDAMVRARNSQKVHDWLVNYLAKKSRHAPELLELWSADADPVVESAAWSLTSARLAKQPETLDLDGILDRIEREMPDAPERLQWSMNFVLGEIGIAHPEHRERVIALGERIGAFRDYPVSPGCVSPFVPIWVPEMVRRAAGEPTESAS